MLEQLKVLMMEKLLDRVMEQLTSRGRHQFSFFLILIFIILVNYSMILYVYPYVELHLKSDDWTLHHSKVRHDSA
jgi:hypothetical protein